MYSFRVVMALLLLSCCPGFGATPAISVKAIPPGGALRPGQAHVLVFELSIPRPYHINSNAPLEEFLIPTTVELDPIPGMSIGRPMYPPARVRRFAFSESPMSVFEGTARVAASITPAQALSGRTVTLKGWVRYQACDDEKCFPPARQQVAVSVSVGMPSNSGAAPSSSSGGASREGFALDFGSSDLGGKGLPWLFALVFLGGLALNLTPCVYPMIPITVSYFGGQAGGRKGSVAVHAALYLAGMATTYSILGVVAAITGGFLGAAYQHPIVLIGIALVMTLLALSMFDVYTLTMPGFLNRLAGISRGGFLGSLLMGLTVGIVAAPCIGPFVFGLLTYVGRQGNPVLGFFLFFVLAIGMGVPLLALALFSGSIQRLPRSGEWMIWIRKLFGFVLLAMAVFFVEPLFPSLLAYHLALALIMLLAGVYLAWIAAVPGSGKGFAVFRNAVGALLFAAALYFAAAGLETLGTRPAEVNQGVGIEWHPYTEQRFARALQDGKPIFIDFYADWCAPCKELDERTFSAPEVIERSRAFVMLKADLTSADNPEVQALRKKFQVSGVPTLVFLGPEGAELQELRVTGFEPKERMLERMSRALSSAEKDKRNDAP